MPPLKNPKHESVALQKSSGVAQLDIAKNLGLTEGYVSKLCKKVQVLARISELSAEIRDKSTWSAAKVLQYLGELVEIQGDDFEKPKDQWTPAMLRWACEVEDVMKRSDDGVQAGESKAWDKVGQRFKITNRDKLKALELIGRHKAVDAFVADKLNAKLDVEVTLKQTTERLHAGRLRLVNAGE